MATQVKAKDTSKYLSPKQAARIQSRADAYFKINPSVKQIITTVDGNIFSGDETGQHAAEQHAKALKSKIILVITKGDTIEGGDSAEKTLSGKPNPAQAKHMNQRAEQHFKTKPEDESVLCTVDGNLFANNEEGEQAAENHAKKLINTNVFEITKDAPVEADEDGEEAKRAEADEKKKLEDAAEQALVEARLKDEDAAEQALVEARLKDEEAAKQVQIDADRASEELEKLLSDGKGSEALQMAMGLSDAVKEKLPTHIHELLNEASKA